MGDKKKQNGETKEKSPTEKEVGVEAETTDDEGGVDTPPPVKEEVGDEEGNFEVEQIVDMECQRRWKCPVKFRVRWVGYTEKDDTWLPVSELNCDDLINEFLEISGRSSEYKTAMATKKRAVENGERTMQTRKAMRYTYSELDEDQDEVMPAGTRSRKVKPKTEPKLPKVSPKKKKRATVPLPVKQVKPKEYEVEAVVDHRVRGRFTEYKVRWKGFGPQDDSWLPEAELNCDQLLNKYFKTAGHNVEESYEVEKILNERQKGNRKEYLVQWKNLGPKHNSWEPEENLDGCKEALRAYANAQKKKSKGKPGKGAAKHKTKKGKMKDEEEEDLDMEIEAMPLEPEVQSRKSGKGTPKRRTKKPRVKDDEENDDELEGEVEAKAEPQARSRRTGKNRSYSEFYDQ